MTERQAIADAVALLVADQGIADAIDTAIEVAMTTRFELPNGTVIGSMITVMMAYVAEAPHGERATLIRAIGEKMHSDLRALNLVC